MENRWLYEWYIMGFVSLTMCSCVHAMQCNLMWCYQYTIVDQRVSAPPKLSWIHPSSPLFVNYHNRTWPSCYSSAWALAYPQMTAGPTTYLSPIAANLSSFNDQIACFSLKLALSCDISWAREAIITCILVIHWRMFVIDIQNRAMLLVWCILDTHLSR